MLTLFPRFFRLIQVHLYNLQCSPRTHIRTWKISIDWSKGLSANGAEGKWGKQKLNCVNCNSLNQLIYSQTFENVGDYSSNMLVFSFKWISILICGIHPPVDALLLRCVYFSNEFEIRSINLWFVCVIRCHCEGSCCISWDHQHRKHICCCCCCSWWKIFCLLKFSKWKLTQAHFSSSCSL